MLRPLKYLHNSHWLLIENNNMKAESFLLFLMILMCHKSCFDVIETAADVISKYFKYYAILQKSI